MAIDNAGNEHLPFASLSCLQSWGVSGNTYQAQASTAIIAMIVLAVIVDMLSAVICRRVA